MKDHEDDLSGSDSDGSNDEDPEARQRRLEDEQFPRKHADKWSCLRLSVWDHDVVGDDDFLGECYIDLCDIEVGNLDYANSEAGEDEAQAFLERVQRGTCYTLKPRPGVKADNVMVQGELWVSCVRIRGRVSVLSCSVGVVGGGVGWQRCFCGGVVVACWRRRGLAAVCLCACGGVFAVAYSLFAVACSRWRVSGAVFALDIFRGGKILIRTGVLGAAFVASLGFVNRMHTSAFTCSALRHVLFLRTHWTDPPPSIPSFSLVPTLPPHAHHWRAH